MKQIVNIGPTHPEMTGIQLKKEITTKHKDCRESMQGRLKFFGYISPICPQAPLAQICTKFGLGAGVAHIITCDNFFGEPFNSIGGVTACRKHNAFTNVNVYRAIADKCKYGK